MQTPETETIKLHSHSLNLEVKKIWEPKIYGDVRRYEVAVQFPQNQENIQSIFVNFYGRDKVVIGPCFFEDGIGEIKELKHDSQEGEHIKNCVDGTQVDSFPSLMSLEEYSERQLEDWELNPQEIYQKYFQDGNLRNPEPESIYTIAQEQGTKEFRKNEEARKIREKFGAEVFCRISGLTLAHAPNLSYRVLQTEINFAGFDYKARRKLLADIKAMGPATSIENRRLAIYVALWHLPVEFKHAKSYPVNQFWDTKLGKKISSIGTICRLSAVAEYYQRQDDKNCHRFPRWRFVNDGRNNFDSFFAFLNLWEKVIEEIENPKDHREIAIKASMDANFEVANALKTGDEESVELAMLTEFARLSRKERPSIFDRRHPAHSKKIKPGTTKTTISHVLDVLGDFYSIPFEKQGAFRKFALSPQSQSLDFIVRTKERFAEIGGIAEDVPAYHGQFMNWLNRHIEIRKTVRSTISKVREQNIPNIQMENKIADVQAARGKPNRENFLKEKDYLQALINWKKSQQAPQFRIIPAVKKDEIEM